MARPRLGLCLVFCPFLAFGQTNNPGAASYPANRYLLVVETSRSMQRRVDGMAHSVQELLVSAIAGQARRGDTLGVWTFNEELYSGLLPLQQWSIETPKVLSERVVGFLRAQQFEKRARFDKVFPVLDRLVGKSPFITVILVCVGEDEVHGTPFDQRINTFFQTWRLQQQDARTPFVIALRAQAGRYVDCAMNPAPWPPELPALPKELFVAIAKPRPPAAIETRKPAAAAVPPLIISGRKPESNPAIKTADSTQAKAQAIVSAPTNLVPRPALTAPDLVVAGPQEGSAKTAAPPLAEPAGANAPASVSPLRANPVPSAPSSAASDPSPIAQPPTTTLSPPPAAGALMGSQPVRHSDAATTDIAPLPKPADAAMAEAPPQPKMTGSHPASPAGSDASATPVEVATAAPGNNHFNATVLWMTGLAFLAGVSAAVWIWRRRARAAEEVSLITESIDRRKD